MDEIRPIEMLLSPQQLADLIGENHQQVNRAIKGDVSPKAREIRSKIAKILDR